MTNSRLMVGANTKERIPDYLFTETGELNISDAKKILGVTADAVVNSVEALNNELRVNVSTVFRVIYESENGITAYSSKVDSNRSIIIEGIQTGTRAIVCASVLDCEYAGANNIKAKCTVLLSGWYVLSNSLNFLQSQLDGIYCQTDLIKVENVEILPSSKLNLTFNNEARMPISKILDYRAVALVNNVFPSNGSFQIEGEVALKAVMLSDNGQFMCQTYTNMFNTEIMAEEIFETSTIDACILVNSVDLSLSSQDNRAFISDIKLTLNATASNMRELEGVVDAYSTSNELIIKESVHRLDSLFCLRSVRDKVTKSVKVKNGISDVECVVGALVGGCTITKNNGLSIEGIITGMVIYSNENNILDSINIEIPYLTMIAKDFECDSNLYASVAITGIFARLRTASEIEVSAEILVSVKGKRSIEIKLINDIELGDEKEIDDVAISLYLVKPNQTLWEIAKDLNTSENIIINQNPDLKLPLKAGEKIILYKEINFDI